MVNCVQFQTLFFRSVWSYKWIKSSRSSIFPGQESFNLLYLWAPSYDKKHDGHFTQTQHCRTQNSIWKMVVGVSIYLLKSYLSRQIISMDNCSNSSLRDRHRVRREREAWARGWNKGYQSPLCLDPLSAVASQTITILTHPSSFFFLPTLFSL